MFIYIKEYMWYLYMCRYICIWLVYIVYLVVIIEFRYEINKINLKIKR